LAKMTTSILGSKKYYRVRGELRRALLKNKILAEDIAI